MISIYISLSLVRSIDINLLEIFPCKHDGKCKENGRKKYECKQGNAEFRNVIELQGNGCDFIYWTEMIAEYLQSFRISLYRPKPM